ncbi:MAG: methionine adenosyltransferase [Candidatus Caldarchaeum sp.]|uniref:Methionine adenosyltransferase n=1 Tax=Caldiarchaeum subterraneum TaxID=311458 RepID=A0A7C4I751_CALS0
MRKSFVTVEPLDKTPVEKQEIEMVERKGLGHPDYIIDSACEEASLHLSKYYLSNYGQILHHNLDKGLLVGGRAYNRFGYGRLEEPITIIIAGRASTSVKTPTGEEKIPYREIITEAVRSMVKRNFRFLDFDQHIELEIRVRESSPDLKAVVEMGKEMPLANDTSYGVAFYPFTTLENLVLTTERHLNSPQFKSRVKESGEDVKVMGLRKGSKITLTVADGIVSTLTKDRDHYIAVKEQIKKEVEDLAAKLAGDHDVEVYVNTADKYGTNIGDEVFYLTFTGTSAEHGDDGNTGRGNRANGLITPNRQMSLEATAGKNPISHVGKIYNVAAGLVARRIYEETKRVKEVYVRMLSQIGKPINEPLSVSVQVIPDDRMDVGLVRDIEGIVYDEVASIRRVTELIISRQVSVF